MGNRGIDISRAAVSGAVVGGSRRTAPAPPPIATPRLRDDEFARLTPVTALIKRERTYRRFLALADAVGTLVGVLVVLSLWGVSFKWPLLVCPLVAVVVAKIQGLYDRDDMAVRKSTLNEWRVLLRSAALTGIGSYLVWYSVVDKADNRGMRVFACLVMFSFLTTLPLRAVARRAARKVSEHERCLIIGTPHRCAELATRVESVEGVDLIGTVSNADVDCSVAGVRELAEQLGVQRIIIGPHRESSEPDVLRLIRSAKWLGLRISLMPTLMTVVGASTTVDEIDSMVLLGVPRFGLSRSSQLLKRSLDLTLGGLVLLLVAPIMAVIAVVIKLDSDGPVFFRQERVGRAGQLFTIFKFRSMVDGADLLKASLDEHNETEGLFKLADDPRITKVGKILRKSYLDELPQLFNVMRGEMSLVGPRPLIECEDALLQGHDRHRSRLTPGMTGPWQLRGPLNASLTELARLDYMYASNWSIWADVDILLGTAARVLNRRGH